MKAFGPNRVDNPDFGVVSTTPSCGHYLSGGLSHLSRGGPLDVPDVPRQKFFDTSDRMVGNAGQDMSHMVVHSPSTDWANAKEVKRRNKSSSPMPPVSLGSSS